MRLLIKLKQNNPIKYYAKDNCFVNLLVFIQILYLFFSCSNLIRINFDKLSFECPN